MTLEKQIDYVRKSSIRKEFRENVMSILLIIEHDTLGCGYFPSWFV